MFGMMNFSIVPTAECHFEGLRQTLDIVAREKKYLAFLSQSIQWGQVLT